MMIIIIIIIIIIGLRLILLQIIFCLRINKKKLKHEIWRALEIGKMAKVQY